MFKQLTEKDQVIEDLNTQLQIARKQVDKTLQGKTQKEIELADRNREMENLKENSELKANREELNWLRKQLKTKETKIEKLTKSV